MNQRAADGSPVELYARMPTYGEPELVDAALPAGTEVLELGSGAGRMTHRLLELGHPVVAVDSSAEMLAHVRGAETVHADIAGLNLGKRFGCVLLASQLVNTADDRERAAFLEACARHVAPSGVVLIQRYDPAWAAAPGPSETERDGVVMRVVDPRREGPLLHATVEYEIDGRQWRHGPFTSRILTDEELEARLNVAGLRLERWLDEGRTWLLATPGPDTAAVYVEAPEPDRVVAAYRERWDAAGTVVPAHVTVLYPFLDPAAIDDDVHRALSRLAARTQPFTVDFAEAGRFPDVLWLAPEPVAPFERLTDAIVAVWPDHPPYGGAFDRVIHHLTVADRAPSETLDALEAEVRGHLPIRQRVDELVLSTRRSGVWRVERRYPLGRIGSDA